MAFLGKTYKLVKQENMEGLLKSYGLTDDKIKTFLALKPTDKLVLNGDTYTYNYEDITGPKELTFKSGVEFEFVDSENTNVKCKVVMDGNTVMQTMKTDKGNALLKKEYRGDELLVTITSDMWDGVSHQYFKV